MSDEVKCISCHAVIDPDYCHCGEQIGEGFVHDNHMAIPMGCNCFREFGVGGGIVVGIDPSRGEDFSVMTVFHGRRFEVIVVDEAHIEKLRFDFPRFEKAKPVTNEKPWSKHAKRERWQR